MKKIFLVSGVIFCLLFLVLGSFLPVQALNSNDAYKAIVKIYTYLESSDYYLGAAQTGSGVILNSTGVILTNYHVVTATDSFDQEVPVVFKICLTASTTTEPDCSYSADLISKDEDKDIALLKIRNIAGLSKQTSFTYLDLAATVGYKEGDSVRALGYPGIGEDTITITTGSVTGVVSKYSLNWIKTDALIAQGSSGGALIDNTGRLIGITSASHADLLGSMGYAIDITAIKSWIDANVGRSSQSSTLQNHLENFLMKQNSLKTTNTFVNNLPYVSLTKPANWEFTFNSENSISCKDSNNANGGGIAIAWYKEAVLQNSNSVDSYITLLKQSELFGVTNQQDIIFAGKSAKKLTLVAGGDELYWLFMASKNYIVTMMYYYGKNNVNKQLVDQALTTIVISDAGNNFVEQKSYTHQQPYFKINLPASWGLKSNNSATYPVEGANNQISGLTFSVLVDSLTTSEKNMSNEAYYHYNQTSSNLINDLFEALFGFATKSYDASYAYKINNELTNEIFYKTKLLNEDELVKAYGANYLIRQGDYIISVSYSYFGENEQLFNSYLSDFEKNVLVNFTVGRAVTPPTTGNAGQQPATTPPATTVQRTVTDVELGITQNSLGGELIKTTDSSTVYLVKDGKRYRFPQAATYKTWYGSDFSRVKTISTTELASYQLANNVVYKPGSLVKLTTDPKVYLVTDNGVLRWIATEEVFLGLGYSFNQVNDLPDSLFTNYSIGADITSY